jgi:hypothetical protein
MKDEALKLALEALELHGKQYPHMVKGYCLDAITAIKQALAAQQEHEPENEPHVSLASVQEPVGLIDRLINPEQHYEFTDPKKANAVLMSLCQEAADALAAPVQEPVTCYCCHSCFKASSGMMLDRMILCSECGNKRCPKASDHRLDCTSSNDPGQPGSVYTTPPAAQRQWVGLTTAQRKEIERQSVYVEGAIRMTEAKLKENNI